MYQSLYLSTKFDSDMETAMENQDLGMLNGLVVNAMKMGLGAGHEKVKRAKAMAETLGQQQNVQVQVEAAFSSQNQELMKAALEKADKVDLKTSQVVELRKLVAGAGAIKQLLKDLGAAVQAKDLGQLGKLYEEAEKLGLHDDVVTEALVLKERLELVADLTKDLDAKLAEIKSAPSRQVCSDLMDLVARAMQCAHSGPQVSAASQAVEAAEKTLDAIEALDATVAASELASARTSGITARDITQLQAALAPAKMGLIKDRAGPADALLARMKGQLAVQKLITEGISSKDLAQLKMALERAQEAGLEITLVQQARACVQELPGGGAVLDELRNAKSPVRSLEDWNKKTKMSEQLQFHFSHFEGVRVPADFLVGVQKNRKRVQVLLVRPSSWKQQQRQQQQQ
jgi:hypothetical protein